MFPNNFELTYLSFSQKFTILLPAKEFAYNASKTALNAYTIHLANELRETNIKVNSGHPGWVKQN